MTDEIVQVVDLRPKVVNVFVRRNDNWSFQAAMSTTVAGVVTPTNLTGYTITAQLRDRADSATATALVITATAANLTAGIFYVGQTAAVTSGVYDVQLTPPAGLPRTYIAGRISVDPDVTRP